MRKVVVVLEDEKLLELNGKNASTRDRVNTPLRVGEGKGERSEKI